MMGSFYSCEVFQNDAIRQTLEDMAREEPRTTRSVKISLVQTLKNYNIYERAALKRRRGNVPSVAQSDNDLGRSKTITDWLMRLTVVNTLGADFAKKHHLWV